MRCFFKLYVDEEDPTYYCHRSLTRALEVLSDLLCEKRTQVLEYFETNSKCSHLLAQLKGNGYGGKRGEGLAANDTNQNGKHMLSFS